MTAINSNKLFVLEAISKLPQSVPQDDTYTGRKVVTKLESLGCNFSSVLQLQPLLDRDVTIKGLITT